MAGAHTKLLWQQFYHHTTGEHEQADAASISAETTTDWTADSTTASAKVPGKDPQSASI